MSDTTISPARPTLSAPTPRRTRLLERTVGLIAIAAIVGAGVMLVRATGDGQPSYRTAEAATQSVLTALDGVATIEPVDQAIVGFPATGTVSTLDVAVGDVVAIGQQLASLDTLELERDLREKQAALAQAQLVLSVALDGDDPTSLIQGSGQTPMGFASTAVAADTASDVSPELASAQQAVLAAQQAADAALADAAAALDSAIAVCDTVATAADPASAIGACQAALVGVVSAQRTVSVAQDAVTTAADALDALLLAWASELESSAGSGTPTTEPGAPTTSEPSTGELPAGGEGPADGGGETELTDGTRRTGASTGPSGGGSTAVTNSPSSEDLIAYQFDVDAAQFAVDAAQQALAQAAIVSPIAGTVTAVDLQVGDEVTAGSTTQTIVVEGPGGYEATMTVSINDIADIHLTQKADVIPDGATEPIAGKVVAIAPTPDPSSSTTSYRVTIGFNDGAAESNALRNGNIGDASIVTGVGTDVIAVPTSAITLDGGQQIVTIIGADDEVTSTPVSVGLVGDEWTEILSGIAVGDIVVLADLGEPLPGSATDVGSNTGTFDFGDADTRFAQGVPTFSVGPGG